MTSRGQLGVVPGNLRFWSLGNESQPGTGPGDDRALALLGNESPLLGQSHLCTHGDPQGFKQPHTPVLLQSSLHRKFLIWLHTAHPPSLGSVTQINSCFSKNGLCFNDFVNLCALQHLHGGLDKAFRSEYKVFQAELTLRGKKSTVQAQQMGQAELCCIKYTLKRVFPPVCNGTKPSVMRSCFTAPMFCLPCRSLSPRQILWRLVLWEKEVASLSSRKGPVFFIFPKITVTE